nr:MAG TPA: hypothetical protein [Caudoviricetes sp.]
MPIIFEFLPNGRAGNISSTVWLRKAPGHFVII